MEIRHSPIPLYSPLQPASRRCAPAPQETGSTTGLPQDYRDNGLTEYITRDELVKENNNTDAARALTAYRSNNAPAGGSYRRLDEMV